MKPKTELGVWMFLGVIGAVGIGILLIPLRTLTSASNLAFVFLALTIIVAEMGGRSAAVLTALLSGVSLNFFLTEPYLNLSINKRDDIIAFAALMVCGLISAAFGKRRIELTSAAQRTAADLEALKRVIDQLKDGNSLEKILFDLKQSFGLGTIVFRDPSGAVLSAVPSNAKSNEAHTKLNNETLFPSDATQHRLGTRGFRLPEEGGRLSIPTPRGSYSIDLWEGSPQGLDLDEGVTLGIAFYLLVSELTQRLAPQPH